MCLYINYHIYILKFNKVYLNDENKNACNKVTFPKQQNENNSKTFHVHVGFICFLVFVLKRKNPFPKASCDKIVGISENPNKITGISTRKHLKLERITWIQNIWSDLGFWILSIFLIFFWIQAILFWFQRLFWYYFWIPAFFFRMRFLFCWILVNFWPKNQSSLNHQVVCRIHGA